MPSQDKGISSRKFILTLLVILLITGLAVLSVWFPSVSTVLPTYIGGVLGALGVYAGANVGQKYVTNKHPPQPIEKLQDNDIVGDQEGDA